MNHDFLKRMKQTALAAMAVVMGLSATSCDDEIDKSNRFTFKGELISTYLENNPEKFSSFTTILSKAKLGKKSSGSILKTLSTYGSYTCFAPTNEAIDEFLNDQYEKYLNGENTGITDPSLEMLSDSMATVIAQNHIIEMAYRTIDINSSGTFPGNAMSGRFINMRWKEDENTIILNNSIEIITQDVETENGFIQVIDGVLNPSNKLLHELIGTEASFSLFYEAIMLTGLDSLLSVYELDPNYDGEREHSGELASEPDSETPYPKTYNQRYTVLVEPDELYKSLGYETIDDIIELANKWYNPGNLSQDILDDYTHRENPLNKYVAYHILDRQLKYNSSTSPGGFIMENYVNEGYSSLVNLNQNFDSNEYYETMMPHTMIKVTKPYTNPALKSEIVLNYAQEKGTTVKNPEMGKHLNVIVERQETMIKKYPALANFDQGARNGIVHVIDRILIYNEDEMAGNVLNERMRIDLSALFPELTNNDVRWALSKSNQVVTYIPKGYCKYYVENNENTETYYYRPHATYKGSWANYQGDEWIVEGLYDFQYRIPSVPKGTYEIRFGYPRGFYRGVCQFYFDGKICGIPVDLRWKYNQMENPDDPGNITIGWFPDFNIETKEPLAEDEIKEKDKAMRNKGYMKGPASIGLETNVTMRESPQAIRKIIGTFSLSNDRSYWLRFKDVTENSDGKNQFDQDYLEIVPTSIISNPLEPEDIY